MPVTPIIRTTPSDVHFTGSSDDIVEGVENLYFTAERVLAVLAPNQSIRFSKNTVHETTGGIDAHSAIFDPPILELTDGLIVSFTAAGDSYLPNPTFTPNTGSIPPIEICRFDNTYAPLEPVDITSSNWHILQYNLDAVVWVLYNPNVSIIGEATQTALDAILESLQNLALSIESVTTSSKIPLMYGGFNEDIIYTEGTDKVPSFLTDSNGDLYYY